MYALCSDAMLKAITRQARAVDEKVKAHNASNPPISIAYFFDHLAVEEDMAVMVTEQDFLDANTELVPSVSADELSHYDRVRKSFEGAGTNEHPQKSEKSQAPGMQARREIASSLANDKGKGKGKGKGNLGGSVPANHTQIDGLIETKEDSDDEYVIRTDHLTLNGSVGSGDGGSGKGKGKGKGKGRGKNNVDIAEGGFGDAAEGEEDLYS
jgi:peroxin-6